MLVSHWNQVKQQRNTSCARLWKYFLNIYYSTSDLSAVPELLCCADAGSKAVTKMDPLSAPFHVYDNNLSKCSTCLSEHGIPNPVCATEISVSEGEVSFMQNTHADDTNRTPLNYTLLSHRTLIEEAMAVSTNFNCRIDVSNSKTLIKSYTTARSSSGGGHSAGAVSTSRNPASSSGSPLLKRTRDERDGDEDDCDDQGRHNKRLKHDPAALEHVNTKTLACPYSKRYPYKYSSFNTSQTQYRNCSSGYWTTISRLKQHLYRVHSRPEHYCPRCFEGFKSEELLETHAQRICDLTVSPYSDKMSKDQMSQIKRRNSKVEVTNGWYEIYQILFPNEALPKSPFSGDLSTVLLQSFKSFCLQEAPRQLPAIIRSQLGLQIASTAIQPELLQSVLEDLASQLVQSLSRDFQQQIATESNSSIDDFEGLPSNESETSHDQQSSCNNLSSSFPDTTSTYITNPEEALSTFSTLYQPDQSQSFDSRAMKMPTWQTYDPNFTSFSQPATSTMLNGFDTALGEAVAPLPNLSSTFSLPHYDSNDPYAGIAPWTSDTPQLSDPELFETMLVDDVGNVVPE